VRSCYAFVKRHDWARIRYNPWQSLDFNLVQTPPISYIINLIIALGEELKIDIPEADYAKMVTLNDCVEYLVEQVEQS
jgi:hypothetical protein